MGEKHFELLADDKIEFTEGGELITLYRVKAKKALDHCGVSSGDLGGYIQNLTNLQDDAWVGGSARVYGDAVVSDKAVVAGFARVKGNALVTEDAYVSGQAKVQDGALVCGNAKVLGSAKIFDNACVEGDAEVSGNAQLLESSVARGTARISGSAKLQRTAVSTRAGDTAFIYLNEDQQLTVTKDFLTVGCVSISRLDLSAHDNPQMVEQLGLDMKYWPGLRKTILGVFEVVDAA